MAQKLDADLNIIQRSGIEVQIDPITADLNIIQALDDEPNDVGGLSAAELKAKFDEAGNIIKTFINDSLIPQVTAETVSEEQRELNEQQRQDNEAQRQANEAVRQENEEEREAAEAARAVWEDYDPAKAYVPGNKVYWAGSSYVNKAPCTGISPNVAANWQMVAKRGETVGSGMTEEDADERYLQLSGGAMTGPLTVLEPTQPNQPVTLTSLQPVSLAVTRLPDKRLYGIGDAFDPTGMEVEASYSNGPPARVTGYLCEPDTVEDETEKITVRYTEARAEKTAEMEMQTAPSGDAEQSTLPQFQAWYPPVYGGGVWVASAYGSTNTSASAYALLSEDGKVWTVKNLPANQYWLPPIYEGGVWFIRHANIEPCNNTYSEDGGKTWLVSSPPNSAYVWMAPVLGDGIWVQVGFKTQSTGDCVAAYSEDGWKTWHLSTIPSYAAGHEAAFVNNLWFIPPYGQMSRIAYSEDGKVWRTTPIPVLAVNWNPPVYYNGIYIMFPKGTENQAMYSEDGETWTAVTLPVSKYFSEFFSADGAILAVANVSSSQQQGCLLRSEDGKNWSQVNSWPGAQTSNQMKRIVRGDGVWVATFDNNNASTLAYSEDGAAWTTVNLGGARVGNGLAFADGKFILLSFINSADAFYSEDGKTWASVALPNTERWFTIGNVYGTWFAGGKSNLASSEDGEIWKLVEGAAVSQSTGNANAWSVPAYGGGAFVSFYTFPETETQVPSNISAIIGSSKRLINPDGPNAEEVPAPTLPERVAALEEETAAITAAIERGMSL